MFIPSRPRFTDEGMATVEYVLATLAAAAFALLLMAMIKNGDVGAALEELLDKAFAVD